jgi:hypothetical protein
MQQETWLLQHEGQLNLAYFQCQLSGLTHMVSTHVAIHNSLNNWPQLESSAIIKITHF